MPSDKTLPTLSVVIPTYNGERYLADAIASITLQTLRPDSVYIVDDCSTDQSCSIAQELAPKAPFPIHVIRLPHNSGGPTAPISRGVSESSAQLIAVLDQDDVYTPNCLQRAVECLARFPNAPLAFHWASLLGDETHAPWQSESTRNELTSQGIPHDNCIEIASEHLIDGIFKWGNFLLGYPGFVFRRSTWLEKGGLDPNLKIAGDLEILSWLFSKGPGLLIPHVGYYRREHDANASRHLASMHTEIAIVKTRLLLEQPRLRDNAQFKQAFRAELELLAYWLRQGHCFPQSARVLKLLGDLGVGKLSLANQRLRLRLYALGSRLFQWPKQPSRYTAAETFSEKVAS